MYLTLENITPHKRRFKIGVLSFLISPIASLPLHTRPFIQYQHLSFIQQALVRKSRQPILYQKLPLTHTRPIHTQTRRLHRKPSLDAEGGNIRLPLTTETGKSITEDQKSNKHDSVKTGKTELRMLSALCFSVQVGFWYYHYDNIRGTVMWTREWIGRMISGRRTES